MSSGSILNGNANEGKKFIGSILKNRMRVLSVSTNDLELISFVNRDIITDLLLDKLSVSDVDTISMNFIAEALDCNVDYFLDEDIRNCNILKSELKKENPDIKLNKVKATIHGIMENYEMMYNIYENCNKIH